MMKILIPIGIVFILMMFPYLRYGVLHPHLSIPNILKDCWGYIRLKKYNECKEYGKIVMFTAADSQAFGSGKTLSMVRWVRSVYHQYNNREVWDDEKKEFVKQRIIVISNIQFNDIPCIPFRGKDQFVNLDRLEHNSTDIILFVIDEAGMEFNSRQYKDNLPTDFLVRLLQVRHNKVSFVMTSQRFLFVDKVLRNTTEVVTTCKKKWRIVRLQQFDAYDMENCGNANMIRPFATKFYFATDNLFNAYDTTYNVEKLKQQLTDGELLETKEILDRIGDNNDPVNATPHIRARYRRRPK